MWENNVQDAFRQVSKQHGGPTHRLTQGPENAWWGVSSEAPEELPVYIFLLGGGGRGGLGGDPPAGKRHSAPDPRPWDWSFCSYCQNARQKRK